MKLFVGSVLLFSLTTGLLSCSTSPQKTKPKNDGVKAPVTQSQNSNVTPSVSAGGVLRVYREETLSNGLKVLIIENSDLPSFSMSMLIKTGYASDGEGRSGLASMVAGLVSRETTQKNPLQLSDSFGILGSRIDAGVEADYTVFSAGSLSKNSGAVMELFSEVILSPRFSDKEIARIRKESLSVSKSRLDDPNSFASEQFDKYLYGNHPYARTSLGTEKDLKTIQKKDINRFYLRHYRPNNSMLTVVGRIAPDIMNKIETQFGSWKAADLEPVTFPNLAGAKGLQIRMVRKKGLVQSQIRIGHFGMKRENPDVLAARLAMNILGGGFESRLVEKIRQELGLTYHIAASIDARKDFGAFGISTFTKNESVGSAVSETLAVFRNFVQKGITEDELVRTKGFMKGAFPQVVETPEKLAFNLMLLRLFGVSDVYLTEYGRNVDKLTIKDINQVIQKYLRPDNLQVLVFSDGDSVLNQLKLIGPVEVKEYTEMQ